MRLLGRRFVVSRDLRSGHEDVALAVGPEEEAVRHLGGSGIDADEDVHPEVVIPELSDLHLVQVARLAQGAQDAFAYRRAEPLALLVFLIRLLLILLFC